MADNSEKPVDLFKRYKFDASIRKKIHEHTLYSKPDNWHGLVDILEDWSIIFFFIFCTKYIFYFYSSLVLSLIFYLITICVIGARQRGLADCLHQASHYCLASNSSWNFFLGTFGSGYLIFQNFHGYKISHARKHHSYLGTDKDPDYVELKANGICGENRTSSNVKRYLLNLFAPTSCWKYLLYLLKHRILTKNDDLWETYMRVLYLSGLLLIFIYTNNLLNLLFYWIVPYVTTNMWIGAFIELLEHYPMIETAPRIDIFMSRNRLCGWLWNFFFGVHNENYHLIHHMFPKIPEWEFHSVHKILMEDAIYASLHQKQGWKALLKDVIEVDDNTINIWYNCGKLDTS
ncbi:unnamed protein product [Rotaria magnacalcarata]|uniref:Fatty acid desaturase domain-containing protein n=3 Tax=Rotaria magnacalcarata TaxID=392030 RepID=A0A816ZS63_9BILA|nr:unnamed protein product [Rotaria magnacalcarata]CAF2074838.1 unnamed protein product [Rotaria magnacalcarata]CAF2210369.1 unnamed protein product [Rotaria magnacalcarata]